MASAVLVVISFLGLTYQESMGLLKIIAAGIIGAVTLIALIFGVAWLKTKEPPTSDEPRREAAHDIL